MVEFMRSESNPNFIPDIRITHAMFLFNLEEAGLKFDKNDLDLTEWMLLADFKTALKNRIVKR